MSALLASERAGVSKLGGAIIHFTAFRKKVFYDQGR